jgi:hypothetical protein
LSAVVLDAARGGFVHGKSDFPDHLEMREGFRVFATVAVAQSYKDN